MMCIFECIFVNEYICLKNHFFEFNSMSVYLNVYVYLKIKIKNHFLHAKKDA